MPRLTHFLQHLSHKFRKGSQYPVLFYIFSNKIIILKTIHTKFKMERHSLTTDEAMRLAAYREEQARDPRRVLQMTQKHGRKRSADNLDLYTPDPKRMSYPALQDPVYPARMPMDMHYRQQQQQRLSMDDFSASRQQYPLHQSVVLPNQSFQHNLMQHPHNPLHQPGSAIVDTAKSPGGSNLIEKAAKIRLEDPTISTEEAMKLAGFTDEEAKDKKKQNNVRQKIYRMSLKEAKASQKSEENDVSIQFQEQIAKLESRLETSVEQLEKHVEAKLQQIVDRVDQKLATLTQLLETIASHKTQQDPVSSQRDLYVLI